MRALCLFVCMAGLLSPFTSLIAQHSALIREYTQVVKTYPFSDPDPVANPSEVIYPYSRFDGYAHKATDKTWKMIDLENDYIRLTVYPEAGGKVWGATDKTTGKEFIYYNHVAKFRDLALRGPWASGGIEYNFGITGHAPTTSTPVDYTTCTHPDGSVSCYVASYEWITRTYWSIEVNLPKDKAYFTTTTTWFNQSAIDQPYYQWMTVGYKEGGKGTEFCYPGDHYIGPKGDAHAFPIDEQGRDLSWDKNNNFGGAKGYHVLGHYNDHFGVYWHDEDFGSIHHADYDATMGQKIFQWGQAREGAIWEDFLTDTDGQYVELQAGRLYNQAGPQSAYTPFKHPSFGAGETDQWTEYWYPVKGIDGVSKVSRIGALHVEREGNMLKLGFSPLCQLSTQIHIYNDQEEVCTRPMEAKVLEPFKLSIPELGTIPEGKLRVMIGDHDLLYSELEEDYQLHRPMALPEDFDWNSVYGLYTQGEQLMNQNQDGQAEDYLKQALAKDGYFAPALRRLASLYIRQDRQQEALPLLTKALGLDAYDDEANYLYGLLARRMGRTADAKAAFSITSRSAALRSAAFEQLAELSLKEQDWKKAIQYAEKSLLYNQMNFSARQVLMVTYRKTGEKDLARKQMEEVLNLMPLYHFARFEQCYTDGKMDLFSSMIRNELPVETYLELADWYASVDCLDESLTLLTAAGEDPIALYHKGYLLSRQGKQAEALQAVQQADALSPEQVYPFRIETQDALQWAATVSDSWKIRYYQALLCWANGRLQDAQNGFDRLEPTDFAPFYLSRAKLHELQGLDDYLDDLLQADKIDHSWRAGYALLSYYEQKANWQQVVETGKAYVKRYPANYYLGMKLATGYFKTGQYVACSDLLGRLQILPTDGTSEAHRQFRASHIYQAVDKMAHKNYAKATAHLTEALSWPEHLAVGRPWDYQIDRRIEDYLLGKIAQKQGKKEAMSSAWQQLKEHRTSYFAPANLLVALAMREMGQQAEADQWVATWADGASGNPVIAWSIAAYQGEAGVSDRLKTDAKLKEQLDQNKDFALITRIYQSLQK